MQLCFTIVIYLYIQLTFTYDSLIKTSCISFSPPNWIFYLPYPHFSFNIDFFFSFLFLFLIFFKRMMIRLSCHLFSHCLCVIQTVLPRRSIYPERLVNFSSQPFTKVFFFVFFFSIQSSFWFYSLRAGYCYPSTFSKPQHERLEKRVLEELIIAFDVCWILILLLRSH